MMHSTSSGEPSSSSRSKAPDESASIRSKSCRVVASVAATLASSSLARSGSEPAATFASAATSTSAL
eukprot:899207-Prymnesium_polylepis.1